MDANATVNGIIDFGGGTAAAAGTTMNANDTITGTSTGSSDTLKVSLQNAGGAIGATVSARAQVNTVDLQAPVANVQQVNTYIFGDATGGGVATQTFTYGTANGSFTTSATNTTNATNFAAALNAVAGSSIATVGSSATSTSAVATTAVTATVASTAALKVGMTVAVSVAGTLATGTRIASIVDATTFTLSAAPTVALTTNSVFAFGGGTAGVTVLAPTAGIATPSIAFGSIAQTATVPSAALTVANVKGTVGDTVNFTYGGVAGSYVVQSTEAATADALAAAINNITGGAAGSATAARSTNDVTITANVAGTPLPAIVFAGAAGTLPTVTFTTANRTAVGGISFGNNSGLDALYVNNISGQAATIDQASVSGATQLWADRSTGAVTFTNVGKTTTVGINGSGTTTLGAVDSTTVAGTTATTLAINGGVNAGAVTLNANADGLLKTVTVTSTGGAQTSTGGQVNTVTSLAATASATTVNINAATSVSFGTGITGAALTTLNISGAATLVTLGTNALASTVATVDASGMTAGGVSAVLNTGAPTGFTFTGGAGKDTVTVTGAFSNTPGTISGGGGSTDTIIITTAAMTSATGARFTNFEVLNNQVAASQDASVVAGITTLETQAAGGGFTSMTAGQAANVAVKVTLANTATTYQLTDSTGTADVLGLTFATSTATTVVNATALAVGGFETLNLTVSGGGTSIFTTAGALRIAGTDFGSYAIGTATTDLKTVNVSGAYAAKVDISSNATRVTTLNASANTAGANLKFGGQTGALVVTGTAAADYIEVGTKGAGGTVALSTGGGNDTVIGTYANIAGLNSLSAGDGTDTVSFSDTTGNVTVVDSIFQNFTGTEKFTFASTSGNITWTVGGYANALVTGGGGTLDITASDVTTGALVVDGTGLSGGNLLKLSSTITGDVAVKVTGSAAGKDSITISATGITTNTKMIEIDASANTSSGVTVNLAGSTGGAGTANYVKTGTGADTITLNTTGTTAWLVTAGAGRDTITAGNGVDTIIYTTSATSVGDAGINVDSIVGFTTTADKIGLTNGAATLLRGVTITTAATTTATMATAVTDNTSVGSLADVYAAIAANANFGSGNFAGSAAAAAANQIIAKQINFANGGASGNYLVINDSIAGFQGGFDLVIKVGTATIAAGDIIPV